MIQYPWRLLRTLIALEVINSGEKEILVFPKSNIFPSIGDKIFSFLFELIVKLELIVNNSDNFNFTDKNQKWYGSTIFGLKMDIPILSSGEQLSKITRAKIELEKSNLQLSELEKKLSIEINLAKGNYQFAIEDYYNKKRSLELAERIERKNQIKFSEGIASSFDLRDAQTQLYKTQQSYLMSMLSIINSKAKLESLTSENLSLIHI